MTGRLIFHLGVPKTGTTFLQERVFDEVPIVNNLGRPNHDNGEYKNFFYALTQSEDVYVGNYANSFINKINQAREDFPITIISDELLIKFTPFSHVLNRILTCFPDAEILLTVRNQLSAIESYYLNHGFFIKGVPCADYYNRKKVISFKEYLAYSLDNFFSSYLYTIEYKHFLDVLETYLTPKSIHILPYELMTINMDAYLSQFSCLLNIEESYLIHIQNKKVNQRKPVSDYRLKQLRTLLPIKAIPGSKYIKKKLSLGLAGMSDKVRFTPNQLKELKDLYQLGNKKLIENYLSDEYSKYYLNFEVVY